MSDRVSASDMQADRSTMLLIAEYERSSEFCNHVDNVRNVITSFFLTLVGVGAFLVDRYSSGNLEAGPIGGPAIRVMSVLLVVWLTGVLFIMTIARLRRVQLERYLMMNRILDELLDDSLRGIVFFRDSNIPGLDHTSRLTPRLTGSYFWTLLILIPSGLLSALAAYILLSSVLGLDNNTSLWIASAITMLSWVIGDQLYFRLSKYDL
jgi:hypothetical protein